MLAPQCAAGCLQQKRGGGSFQATPRLGGCVRLEKELESELDLPRVIRSVAGGADSSKVAVGEIRRTTDGHDAVATEARGIEVRVVGDVEDFRSELKLEPFVEREVLEDGEVQAMEAGTRHLRHTAQVCECAGARSAGCRVGESARIPEPRDVLLSVDGNVLDAQFQRLAGE